MKMSLSDVWFEACEELWEMSKDRPYMGDEATLWDAFRFAFACRVNEYKVVGRKVYGEVR